MARASSQHAFGELSSASSMSSSSVLRRPSSMESGVYNARRFAMPLPKSILCTSCKKTYPEGWQRCPYCGYNATGQKLEQQAKRFMEKKIREFEQRTGKTSRAPEEPRRDRPGRGGHPNPQQRQRGDRQRGGGQQQQQPQRQQQQPRPPQQRPPQQQQQAQGGQPAGDQASRRRRRRRGR